MSPTSRTSSEHPSFLMCSCLELYAASCLDVHDTLNVLISCFVWAIPCPRYISQGPISYFRKPSVRVAAIPLLCLSPSHKADFSSSCAQPQILSTSEHCHLHSACSPKAQRAHRVDGLHY